MTHHRNPKALLTPAMRQVIDRMERTRQLPLHALTAQQARAVYAIGSSMLDLHPHALARVEDLQIPVRDGATVNARLYAPSAETLPVLLYFHGGGFTIGSVATHDSLCRHLSHLAQCAVVSVDYRLAPEHKFPTAAHDACDALDWLSKEGAALRLDASRIAVGGDSAGGTLGIVAAIHARDIGLPVRLQLLFYPGCAAHQDTPSHKTFAEGFVLEESHITFFFNHYVNSRPERDDWRFAPLNAPDVDGLAPAWIGLAECDPLVDEGIMYADKLRAAGVTVELEIYRGVVHEFIRMGRVLPEALQAHNDAARALRHAFSR